MNYSEIAEIDELEQRKQFKRIAPNRPNLYDQYSVTKFGTILIEWKYPYAKMIYEIGINVIEESLTTFFKIKKKIAYLKVVARDINRNIDWLNSIINYYEIYARVNSEVARDKDGEVYEYCPNLCKVADFIHKRIAYFENQMILNKRRYEKSKQSKRKYITLHDD